MADNGIESKIRKEVIDTIRTILRNQPKKNWMEIREIVIKEFQEKGIELSGRLKANMRPTVERQRSLITNEPRRHERGPSYEKTRK